MKQMTEIVSKSLDFCDKIHNYSEDVSKRKNTDNSFNDDDKRIVKELYTERETLVYIKSKDNYV